MNLLQSYFKRQLSEDFSLFSINDVDIINEFLLRDILIIKKTVTRENLTKVFEDDENRA